MKKKLLIFGLVLFLINPLNAFAISVNVRCSAPSSVTVGQTFNVTISGSSDASTYWNGSVVNSSSNLRSNSGTGSFVEQNSTTQVSKTYSFTALSEGTATVSQTMTISDENYNEKSFTSNTCSISIVKPAATSGTQASINNITSSKKTKTTEENKNLSSDNSLKNLSIEGLQMKPTFDKDTLEYNVSLSNDTTSIKVIAEKNDEKASVTGDGQIEVKEGNNVINITVTAENGSTRTYKINAYVKEKDPITVTINKKKYTVLKKLTDISAPLGFKEKIIKIDDNEIDAFYNDKLEFTIIGLKDSIGNILLYIYDEETGKYTKYSPIVTDSINIIILDAPDNKIPHRYNKSKFIYNGASIEGYALNEGSDFRVVYGINAETGEKGFYLYDMRNNTIQRFYNDQVNIYVELINKIKLAFLVLGGFILLLTLIIIILLSKNVKFKKKYLEKRLSNIDNPIKQTGVMYQDLEGTTKIKTKEKDEYTKGKTFLDE